MAKRFMGINPKHKGFCTPMTKATCIGARRRLALTLKKHHGFHKKQMGGEVDPNLDEGQTPPTPQGPAQGQGAQRAVRPPSKRKMGALPKRRFK